MKRLLPFSLLLLVLAASLQAADPVFIKPGEIDAESVLPLPPVAGGTEAAAELATVLKLQSTRTPADIARIESEAKLTPASFQPVFGDRFTAENLPILFALLMDVAADSKLISDPAKVTFGRKRPKFVDAHVVPVVEDVDGSYPSGHAIRGILWATILSQIAPDKKDALMQRGQEIGWDRVIAGVHFPSDVYAGRVLGHRIAQELAGKPEFQTQLARAKTEFAAFESAGRRGAPVPAPAH
jgi:membrane-associated phospholipid phosphatase